jgi:hypothetical protein
MVLAAFGTEVEEHVLQSHARMERGGTAIDELGRLARQFHLSADIHEASMRQLQRLLARGKLPIAYIDRAVFDLTPRERSKHSICNATIHTVVPIRVTAKHVTFHDPLPPAVTRKPIGLFRLAYGTLGSRCVVCSAP